MTDNSFRVRKMPSYNQPGSLANYQSYCETPKCQSFQDSEICQDSEETTFYSKGVDKSNPFPDSSPVLECVRHLAGEWGTHRFDNETWLGKSKSFAALKHGRVTVPHKDSPEYENDEEYEEIEESCVLTDEMMKTALSYLERSPIVLKYVLCRCLLSNKELCDISIIKYYHYIQYLDISRNELTTLTALSQLPFLQYLDASSNNLEYLLDFKAPCFLTSVNFSNNFISIIPDLSEFWSITDLNLSYNSIAKIDGLENLRFLSNLDLSYNKIQALENLNNMRIQVLILHNNLIDSNIVEDDPVYFQTLDYIRLVDLSYNHISTLEMFENASDIECIDISHNNIASLLELYYLCNLRYLSRLNLKNNPITTMKYYFNVCVENIKHLIILDEKEITPESRISVKNPFNPLLPGKVSHAELMLLQQINYPNIDSFILPINHPHPLIIVLVGPPGSRKSYIIKKLCRTNKMLVPGISHTTRPMVDGEVDGKDYYFVTNEEFKNLVRNGKFMAVSEFNGYSFGIVHEEIYKAVDMIVVFHSDITAATTLKTRGVNPKLILALPKSELTHLTWIKEKYFLNEVNHEIVRASDSSHFNSKSDLKDLSKGQIAEDAISKVSDFTYGTQCSDVMSTAILGTLRKEPFGELQKDLRKVSFNWAMSSEQLLEKMGKERGTPVEGQDSCYKKIGRLDLFFNKIMKIREELLEIHWSQPGLFHNIIFTDAVKMSLRKLKHLLKNTIEICNLVESPLDMEKDETYERIVKIRLSGLDFQGFTKITNDVPPHCDCDVNFIENNF